jgi:hypothetical protein
MTEKKVYILLTDTGTLFTKLIKLYTKSHIIMHPYPLTSNYQRYIALAGRQLGTHLLVDL